MTSGSGLVVTESGGACILSDSAVPWCVVNLTTCAAPRTVRRNRGEPWDYCARPAHLRRLQGPPWQSATDIVGSLLGCKALHVSSGQYLGAGLVVRTLHGCWDIPRRAAQETGWGTACSRLLLMKNSCVSRAGLWKRVLLKPAPLTCAHARRRHRRGGQAGADL